MTTEAETAVKVVPDPAREVSIEIDAHLLGRMLPALAKSLPRDDSRPVLTCVAIAPADDALDFVVADGWRLLRLSVPIDAEQSRQFAEFLAGDADGMPVGVTEFLLERDHIKTLTTALKSLKKFLPTAELHFAVAGGIRTLALRFYGEFKTPAFSRFDGQFPKYAGLIPDENRDSDGAVTVNPRFLADLAMAALALGDKENPATLRIRLGAETDPVLMSATNGDVELTMVQMPMHMVR